MASVAHMTHRPTVTFYSEPGLRDSAAAGQHNFIAKVAAVLEQSGFEPQYEVFGPIGTLPGQGRTLSHMKQPPDADGLVFRRVYHYPFWQIERQAMRGDWDVAHATFDPAQVDAEKAGKFYRFWQQRLFGDLPRDAARDGFVYVPLQGRLLSHRSFQRCSPLEMIGQTLRHETQRDVIATLHPKETYTQEELASLDALQSRHPRLRIERGGMTDLLGRCEYIVTQNSGVAFDGMLFGKPAMLFADVDFHHIAIKAQMDDLGAGFAEAAQHQPPFATYLYWFWQERCINAGRPEASDQIADRLRRFGWIP